jgi:hypothetical protein
MKKAPTLLSTARWQGGGGRHMAGLLRVSPTEKEESSGSATPRSSSTKRDGDKMLTSCDESTIMEVSGALHSGWGKLQILLAW